MIYKTFMMSSE